MWVVCFDREALVTRTGFFRLYSTGDAKEIPGAVTVDPTATCVVEKIFEPTLPMFSPRNM
jgi:hypothetical protein